MNDIEKAERLLKERGVSPELVAHSRRVSATAAGLAQRWGASPGDAAVAGLLHDLARQLPQQEVLDRARKLGVAKGPLERRYPVQLLHAPVAAAEAAAAGFGPDVAAAIARHTVGGAKMTTLQQCLFLADAIEPGRTWQGVEAVRKLASASLDEAIAEVVRRDLERLRKHGREAHPGMIALAQESHG